MVVNKDVLLMRANIKKIACHCLPCDQNRDACRANPPKPDCWTHLSTEIWKLVGLDPWKIPKLFSRHFSAEQARTNDLRRQKKWRHLADFLENIFVQQVILPQDFEDDWKVTFWRMYSIESYYRYLIKDCFTSGIRYCLNFWSTFNCLFFQTIVCVQAPCFWSLFFVKIWK